MIPFLPGVCVCVIVCVDIDPTCTGKILLGRSHIRSVAEKRMEKIDEYCRVSGLGRREDGTWEGRRKCDSTYQT